MKVFGMVGLYVLCTWNVLEAQSGKFVRWTGNDKKHAEHMELASSIKQGDSVHYDVDLYPYQYFSAQCPSANGKEPGTLMPVPNGAYYVQNSLVESDEKNLKRERESKKIKDSVPEIKIFTRGGVHTFYYSKPATRKDIVRMHFDCVSKGGTSESELLATVQINIIPKPKAKPEDDVIILDDEKFWPKSKGLTYFKFVRPGVNTVTECKNTYALVNYRRHFFPSHMKTIVNPVTGVKYYDMTDVVVKQQLYEKRHTIDLGDGKIVNVDARGLQVTCESNPGKKLVYLAPYVNTIPGLNNSTNIATKVNRSGEEESLVQIRTEDDAKILVDVPDGIYPKDCLNKVYLGNKVVKMSDIVRDPKLTRMTNSLKILDLSTSSSYKTVTVSCYTKVPQDDGHKTTWMDITVSPLCNFYDSESLDPDNKTCTLFSSGTVQSLVATPLEHFGYDNVLAFDDKFFERSDDPEGSCKDCYYRPVKSQGNDMSVSVSIAEAKQNITIKDGAIRFNPVYMLKKVDAEKSEGILNPSQVMRMYLHNKETEIGNDGKVIVKDKVDEGGKSLFYMVQAGGRSSIKISCKDFFEDSGSSQPTLFPNGKNVVYKNVSDGFMDPRTIETVQFGEEFAARGISILKKPETDVDLEIVLDQDKMIKGDHVKPLYFICSHDVKGDWKKSGKPYAVIAIDPGYKSHNLPGCGTKEGIFVDENGKDSGRKCAHTIDGTNSVGFHCPSYVPEHFLEGDQGMHKADGNKATENPYQLLMRCYDRSTMVQKLLRPKTDLELFPKPKFAGELRSLWIFNKDTFAEKDVKEVLCICYDKTGMVLSSIKVWNDTKKVE
ncbi:hypothetical protein BEWA_001790 [Theileria equi strain WA]|uniref:Signal peptide containing protein n=1 Tax=Theileria equi strain WA TaxID=1537102 RepID=L0AYU9_THEEQ|nr:hypothetical protein BEWA_001790 [Theileria equi strain WA]AFZ80772.1 hypothetical protein BEWA_001790 [Theileria equi strain WA]|eukprot:XP_004830438.1 hypothetical protein BEWA_001790 [Theileria equi strain WA]